MSLFSHSRDTIKVAGKFHRSPSFSLLNEGHINRETAVQSLLWHLTYDNSLAVIFQVIINNLLLEYISIVIMRRHTREIHEKLVALPGAASSRVAGLG